MRVRRRHLAAPRRRTTLRPLTVLAAMLIAGCSVDGAGRPAPAASAAGPGPGAALPRSMAALGDSMTRAFILCEDGFGDCPEASWATGTATEVNSHAARIERASGSPIRSSNLAVSGATVSGLDAQARRAVAARVEYVTVLMGANDACASSERSMTPVPQFTAAFDRAMQTLARDLPQARVLVVSIPDLLRLWEVGRDRPEVRAVWQFGICQSMLAEPGSMSAEATARRTRVRERVAAYNNAMGEVCAKYPTCKWDGGAVFDYRFSLEMVSDRDYWHPSRLGQRTISDVAWEASFWPDAAD